MDVDVFALPSFGTWSLSPLLESGQGLRLIHQRERDRNGPFPVPGLRSKEEPPLIVFWNAGSLCQGSNYPAGGQEWRERDTAAHPGARVKKSSQNWTPVSTSKIRGHTTHLSASWAPGHNMVANRMAALSHCHTAVSDQNIILITHWLYFSKKL